MGLYFSCPLAAYHDIENGFESAILKSITFGNDGSRTPLQPISFEARGTEPTVKQSIGSQEMTIEGSAEFRPNETERMSPVNDPSSEEDYMMEKVPGFPVLDSSNPKHEAAIRLQKVYKSFRTRRRLADCAVLIEQSWWKLLDFAELKRSSISFFDLEKHETAISRWSRARTRAAKVGKGLSKNGKARKLALQHWLEAIDPRHRYGHNLHFYYDKWLHSQSKEPFFYWLDIGEGKEVNLVDKCPRSKLQQQCIKYLGPMERKAYEILIEDGKLFYKQTGELLDTMGDHKGAKWIFVLSTSRTLYVGKKKKGTFQHSSFLAGGATSAAGRIVVEEGTLKAVWPHSGHYRPTPENFQDLISFLKDNNVHLTDVKMDSVDEDEESIGQQNSIHLRSNSSDEDLTEKLGSEIKEKTGPTDEEAVEVLEPYMSRMPGSFSMKLTDLEIPSRDNLLERLENESQAVESSSNSFEMEPPLDGYESADESRDSAHNEEAPDGTIEEIVPDESILKRINSHKETKSFQLGKHLSCKWSTGAGPRIGCVRDYPSELQCHALEQVNLSPRSGKCLRSNFSSRSSTPTPMEKRSLSNRSTTLSRAQSSPLCKSIAAIESPS